MTTTESTARAGRYIPDAASRHEIRERLQAAVANLPALPILRITREDDEIVAWDADGYAWAGSFNFARRNLPDDFMDTVDDFEVAHEASVAEAVAIRAERERLYIRSLGSL